MTEPKFTRETCEILMKELGITQTDFETQVPIGESKTPTICLAAAKLDFIRRITIQMFVKLRSMRMYFLKNLQIHSIIINVKKSSKSYK
jgi:hypothetical protein